MENIYKYKSYYYNSDVNKDHNRYTSELIYESIPANSVETADAYIKVNDNVLIKIKSVGKNKNGILMAVILQYVWSRDGNIYMRTIVIPYEELLKVIKPPYTPLLVDFN